jgi:hypothetical protein
LAVSREFGKSVDWLLTGKVFVEPKKVRYGEGNLLSFSSGVRVQRAIAPAQLSKPQKRLKSLFTTEKAAQYRLRFWAAGC